MEKNYNSAGNMNIEGLKEKARHIDQMVQDASNSGIMSRENIPSSARRRSHQPRRAQSGSGISWNPDRADDIFKRSVSISRGEYTAPEPAPVEKENKPETVPDTMKENIKTEPVQVPSERPKILESAQPEASVVSVPKTAIPIQKEAAVPAGSVKPASKMAEASAVQPADGTPSKKTSAPISTENRWKTLIEQNKTISAVKQTPQNESRSAARVKEKPVQSQEITPVSQTPKDTVIRTAKKTVDRQTKPVEQIEAAVSQTDAEPVKKKRAPIHLEPVTINWAKWTPSGGLVDKAAELKAAEEAQRKAAEERVALEATRKAEQERIALEKAEAEARAEAERKAAEERAVLEAARKAEQERIASEKAEAEQKTAEEAAAKEISESETQQKAAPQKIEWAHVHTKDILQDKQKTEEIQESEPEQIDGAELSAEADEQAEPLIVEEVPALEAETVEPVILSETGKAIEALIDETSEEAIEEAVVSAAEEQEELPADAETITETNVKEQQGEQTAEEEEENRRIFEFLKDMIRKSEEPKQQQSVQDEPAAEDDISADETQETFEAVSPQEAQQPDAAAITDEPMAVDTIPAEEDWLISDEDPDSFFEETTAPELPDDFFEEVTVSDDPDAFFEETTVPDLPDDFFEEVTVSDDPNAFFEEVTVPDLPDDFFEESDFLPDDEAADLLTQNDGSFAASEAEALIAAEEPVTEETAEPESIDLSGDKPLLVFDDGTDFWEEAEDDLPENAVTKTTPQNIAADSETEKVVAAASGNPAMDEFFRLSNNENISSPLFEDIPNITFEKEGTDESFFLEGFPSAFDETKDEQKYGAETVQPTFKEEVRVSSEIEELIVPEDAFVFEEVDLTDRELIIEAEPVFEEDTVPEGTSPANDDFIFEEVDLTEQEPVIEEEPVLEEDTVPDVTSPANDDFIFEEVDLTEHEPVIEEEILTEDAFVFEEADLTDREPVVETEPVLEEDTVPEGTSPANDDFIFEEVDLTEQEPIIEEEIPTEDAFVFEEVDLTDREPVVEAEPVFEEDTVPEGTSPANDGFIFEEVDLTEQEPVIEEEIPTDDAFVFEETPAEPIDHETSQKSTVSSPVFTGQKKPVFGGSMFLKPAGTPQKEPDRTDEVESLSEILFWEEIDENASADPFELKAADRSSAGSAAMDEFFRMSDQNTELTSALNHLSETIQREEVAAQQAKQEETERDLTFKEESMDESDVSFDEEIIDETDITADETSTDTLITFEETVLPESESSDEYAIPALSPEQFDLFFENVSAIDDIPSDNVLTNNDLVFDFEEEVIPDAPKMKDLAFDFEEEAIPDALKTKDFTFDFEEEAIPDAPKMKDLAFDFEEEFIPETTDKKAQETVEALFFEEENL